MSKQISAIEWLIQRLEHLIPNHYYPVIEQAKEFEKEQIINAYYTGNDDVKDNPNREGEQYYNETFKSK